MIVNRIEGCTRELGKSQGFTSLPIRDTTVLIQSRNGRDTIETAVMVSSWEPSIDELKKMINGAPILLWVYGTKHPPIRIEVGEPKEKII